MSSTRQILAQGDRDGACFLYCLANAAQALTGKPVTGARWTRCILSLPYDMRDYLAGRGTEKLDAFPELLVGMARAFLDALGLRATIAWHERIDTLEVLQQQVSSTQVLIMAVDNGAHWVTVVDVSGQETFAACSAQALERNQQYAEQLSPNFGRHCNRHQSFASLNAEPGYGLSISLS